MIIDLRTLPHGHRNIELTLDEDWWRFLYEGGHPLEIETPVQVRMKIYETGDKYVLDGDLSGRIRLVCDRCLLLYPWDRSNAIAMSGLTRRTSSAPLRY